MPVTLGNARTDVRSLIDEPVAAFWTDTEINQWLNQGTQEIQRVAEWKRGIATIDTTAGTQEYIAPSDLLRLYRLEFVPTNNTSYTYSLEFRGYNEMDAAWGNLKSLPSAYPEQYTLWNNPNDTDPDVLGLRIVLYPVPAVDGTLNVYYYSTAVFAETDDDNLDIPPDWETMIENYACYRALRKDADPRWQEFKQEFDTQMAQLIDVSRTYTDQANWASTGQQNYNPLFLDLEE